MAGFASPEGGSARARAELGVPLSDGRRRSLAALPDPPGLATPTAAATLGDAALAWLVTADEAGIQARLYRMGATVWFGGDRVRLTDADPDRFLLTDGDAPRVYRSWGEWSADPARSVTTGGWPWRRGGVAAPAPPRPASRPGGPSGSTVSGTQCPA